MSAPTVKAIDRRSVHQICSGQVVVSLATAVKELLENSLDAGATTIEIRLKNWGADSVEVVDNGSGVLPENFEALALKHHTSKLNVFSDLVGVKTFGFRGEALSSLCALSNLSITTCHSSLNIGAKIVYDHDGYITKQTAMARTHGTTVTLQDLFSTLPVRYKEFLRNLKREYAKLVQVVQAYCIISTGVRISCFTLSDKGNKSLVLATNGNENMQGNISNIFGPKQLQTLFELKQVHPSAEDCEELGVDVSKLEGNPVFSITGFISRCDHGAGRGSNDRQYIFINKRPCDVPKLIRHINEVYHGYNRSQYPFVVLNISLNKELVDVNVTPDKRQIFLQQEKLLFAIVKSSLKAMYETRASSYELNHKPLTQTKFHLDRLRNEGNASPSEYSRSIRDRLLLASKDSRKKGSSILNFTSRTLNPKISATVKDQSPPTSVPDNRHEQKCTDFGRSTQFHSRTEEIPLDVKQEDSFTSVGILSEQLVPEGKNKCLIDEMKVCARENVDASVFSRKTDGGRSAANQNSTTEQCFAAGSEMESVTGMDENCTVDQARENTSFSDLEKADKLEETTRKRLETEECFEVEEKCHSSEEGGTHEPKDDFRHLKRALVLDRETSQKHESYGKKIKLDSQHSGDGLDGKPCNSLTVKFDLEKLREVLRKSDGEDFEKETANQARTFKATICPESNQRAEEELERNITKEMFGKMKIIGQFNQGFIVTQLEDDLFIIDQHASDEKYNFEELQKNTVIKSQRLISPQSLDLTAINENILIENLDVFKKNGFDFEINDGAPMSQRVKLSALPVSKNWNFGKSDVDELIFVLSDSPGVQYRPSNVRKMFASRACRMSVMIGTALNAGQMKRIVGHMGEMKHPWNCPHGRPTMRHLINLNMVRK